MSNRIYKLAVFVQISLITLLLLFMLNAETVLEQIRNTYPEGTSFSQDNHWEMVNAASENRYW